MSLILNIDTATEKAGVCLSRNGEALLELQHNDQKNHAGFVQPAIESLMRETGYALRDLDAIAVTAGPGSYTGLRVGMATAKGLCFTLDKPLLLLNTLEVMARAASRHLPATSTTPLIGPMIDARRMEVFTALYSTTLEERLAPAAMILTEYSFEEYLDKQSVVFCGNGYSKFKGITRHSNALFSEVEHRPSDLGALAAIAFQQQKQADLAYSTPFYLKEFFMPASKP